MLILAPGRPVSAEDIRDGLFAKEEESIYRPKGRKTVIGQ
jgi:hypothetical protein